MARLQQVHDEAPRAAICAGMQQLEALGLNHGTAGNVSVRHGQGLLITPSGVAPAALTATAIVMLDATGAPCDGTQRPSSEWRFHREIYQARPEIDAIVHVHSTHATALACLRRDLPAFHYMVAVAGGADVRCAPYATFGSAALAAAARAALEERRACLLANHGMITLGKDVAGAIGLAVEVEELARQYLVARAAGEPVLLDAEEMRVVIEQFKTYGTAHGQS